jgi:two-component system alkaline phosphatase synthesis response regulator PhoP/two-component system response regulator RpaA
MKKILVVDDEPMAHQLVNAVLRTMGDVTLDSAYGGAEALEKAKVEAPDLVISDVNMPDMDGLTLCQKLRETPGLADTLILLLTARGEAQDRYEGFLQGADDYMTKPFDMLELQLRVKALLRRAGKRPDPEDGEAPGKAPGPLTLDPDRYQAQALGVEVRVTGTELAILRYFVAHPDRVVNAETLLKEALDYPAGVGNPQVIHTHLKNIRAKFRQAGVELGFLTSSWQGYMLDTAWKPEEPQEEA